MGALFRSEDMLHLRLYFDRVAARDTVEELGELGIFEFDDLNSHLSAFQRSYASDVRRCDDLLRSLRFLHSEVLKHAPQLLEFAEESNTTFTEEFQTRQRPKIDELQSRTSALEQNLLDMNAHYSALSIQLHELVEMRHVLVRVSDMFVMEDAYFEQRRTREEKRKTKGPVRQSIGSWLEPIMHPSSASTALTGKGQSLPMTSLSFCAGVLEADKSPAFERTLFRATRGNTLIRFEKTSSSMVDPATGESLQKVVFVIFFTGDELREKVTKICRSFGANLYNVPDSQEEQQEILEQCETQLRDVDSVVISTEKHRKELVSEIARSVNGWIQTTTREKAIFHTLNLLNFDTSTKLYVTEGWCPAYALSNIQRALENGRVRSNAQVGSVIEERPSGSETPPTHFVLNRFTQVFHSIVESYGVGQYQEVNPAPFLVVTFPFLFAVMFGDVGHGFIMALAALVLIVMEKRLERRNLGEMLGMMFNGRYIIFLMGVFSIFTGFIYNECFAIPLDLFHSRWMYTDASIMACGVDNCVDPAAVLPPLEPYPFGFDPIWKGAQNSLLFFNSYKMKFSIVMGVSQMLLGLLLSAENARFFRKPVDFFFEFIPQVIFLCSIFGYLVFLIFYKWLTNWNSTECMADALCQPPDLKAILIGMIMSPGNVPETQRMYSGQSFVQVVLLLMAFVSVPWMLLPKPLILRAQNQKKRGYAPVPSHPSNPHGTSNGNHTLEDDTSDVDDAEMPEKSAHGSFDFGEVVVNQGIHTIEFVLGAVSNTASYLRLWALSLAHAELSDVFLEKILFMTWETGNWIAIIIGFCMWLGATIGVLMLMESLSAFLHALRLHWVEFQNKFYNLHGSGRKFTPFAFSELPNITEESR
eukprot:CAMPEP_0182450222 /NCGR_PEP_ID=MMETSP1172-20130603/39844_1 /TAXON_ID=708627 /ORGANISM="Timspurckia oligopyrenoides, Strain CCMP3278" /LENGTH=869 /DNA_ID=CAMNT_0024647757 /DNA_START=179 /DNA_END=2788 /DNA_ORIENTATION=-